MNLSLRRKFLIELFWSFHMSDIHRFNMRFCVIFTVERFKDLLETDTDVHIFITSFSICYYTMRFEEKNPNTWSPLADDWKSTNFIYIFIKNKIEI